VLLLSALPASRVTAAIRREDRPAMQRHILVTVVLGLAFLIGLVLIWRQVPYSGSYSAIFFTMTGFHAVHVVVGMLLFGYIFVKAQRGAYSKENYWSVEGTVIFWHFVELMWVFYFVVLYVL
jgi:heme/copper-type cytochrome/quinol oxidase subunit 3